MSDISNFTTLPLPARPDGTPRRLGIEVEFSGLSEDHAAQIVADVAGGTVTNDAAETWRVETPRLGRCDLYLDTRFRDDVRRFGGDTTVDLARLIVPVELVTQPFDPGNLSLFQRIVAALRDAGAEGSRHGVLLGFGVHLNVEIANEAPETLWRVLTAFGLLEPYLREATGIDVSRRILPFVQPYPAALVDALVDGPPQTLDALIETYLTHSPTRNHGLDMLPIFAHLAPGKVEDRLQDGTETKPRPAYHFRLPDCRIDERDWSIRTPWRTWCRVEQVAQSPVMFERLRQDRRTWARAPKLTRERWLDRVTAILGDTAPGGAAQGTGA